MIGTLIGGTFKITMKAIMKIPFIGKPIVNVLIFFFENLFAAIKKLPYVIVGLIILFVVLSSIGVI